VAYTKTGDYNYDAHLKDIEQEDESVMSTQLYSWVAEDICYSTRKLISYSTYNEGENRELSEEPLFDLRPGLGGSAASEWRRCVPAEEARRNFIMNAAALSPACFLICFVLADFVSEGLLWASFCDGAYLSFTWNLEKRTYYKIWVYVLILVAIPWMVFVSSSVCNMGGIKWAVSKCMSDIVVNCLAIRSLLKVCTPPFAHNSQEFAGAHFTRPWISLFTESNNEFMNVLSKAALAASHGNVHSWANLVASPEEAQQLLATCTTVPPEDSDDAWASSSSSAS